MAVHQYICFMLLGYTMMDLSYDLPFLQGSFTVQDQLASFTYYSRFQSSFMTKFIDLLIGIGFISMLYTIYKRRNLLSVLSLLILLGAGAYFASVVVPYQLGFLKVKFVENTPELINSFQQIAQGHIILIAAILVIVLLEIYQQYTIPKQKTN